MSSPFQPRHSERSAESGGVARGGENRRRWAARNDVCGAVSVNAFNASAVILLGALSAVAQAQPTELTPEWDRSFPRGIEWCRPVGGESEPTLLLCTKDSLLDVIELSTGRGRLDEAISVQQGTRFAGALAGAVYCHGVSQVYELRVARGETDGTRPGLVWQVAAAPPERTDGDPEFMTRVVAAHATPGGVLVVRSDGRIAELLRDEGSVRWQDRLPEMAECELLVREATAALVGKSGDALSIAFIDLSSARPRLRLTTVAQPPPIWSGLTSDGLVAMWPERFALVSPDGSTIFVELPPGISATAATVAVFEHAAPRIPQQHASVLLVGGSTENPVCAYDFASRAWDCPERDASAPCERIRPPSSMWICGDHVLRSGYGSLIVSDATTCEHLITLRHRGWVVDGTTRDGVAYGLFSEFQSPHDVGPVRLARRTFVELSCVRADQRLTPELQRFLLGSAMLLLDTFWANDTLVVVEEKRVRAYTLP